MHCLDHGPPWLTALLITGAYLLLALGASQLGRRLVPAHQANNLDQRHDSLGGGLPGHLDGPDRRHGLEFRARHDKK